MCRKIARSVVNAEAEKEKEKDKAKKKEFVRLLERIAVSLGSKVVKRLALERSFHVITLDVERDLVFRAVADHVREHAVLRK